ncbi:MAG TPA: hypothetical protein VI197_30130, partial [Polyangiaceae bacterium]
RVTWIRGRRCVWALGSRRHDAPAARSDGDRLTAGKAHSLQFVKVFGRRLATNAEPVADRLSAGGLASKGPHRL